MPRTAAGEVAVPTSQRRKARALFRGGRVRLEQLQASQRLAITQAQVLQANFDKDDAEVFGKRRGKKSGTAAVTAAAETWAAVEVERATKSLSLATKWITEVDLWLQLYVPAMSYSAPPKAASAQSPSEVYQQVGADVTERIRGLASLLGEDQDLTEASGGDTDEWNHLRGLGVISDSVLDDLLKRQRPMRTRPQRENSIGASKELLEATLRGTLTLLGKTYQEADPLGKLMKAVNQQLVTESGTSKAFSSGTDGTARMATGLASLIDGLVYVRNQAGTGHGRPVHASGLTAAHSQLAADSVLAVTRFIASRLRDLGHAANRR